MKNLLALIKSFGYAGRGVFACAARERNFRIHICAAVTVAIFAALYGATRIEAAVLALAIALVMGLEAANTAVEAAADLAWPERSELARLAKDAAAGAVLIAAVGSIVVAVFVFGDAARLVPALMTLLKYWYLTAAYIVIMALFVFGSKYRRNL